MTWTTPRCGAVDPEGRVCILPAAHVGQHADAQPGPQPKSLRRKVVIIAAVVVIAVAGYALTRPLPKAPGTSSYGIGATGVGAAPVTVSGSGMMSTAIFQLVGSEYAVTWAAQDTGNARVGCFHSADLYNGSGRHVGDLGTAEVPGGGTQTGVTYLHNLQRGDHFVKASSGCDWTITFAAQ